MVSGRGNCKNFRELNPKFEEGQQGLTQESIVGVRLEQFFRSVEIETERQEDFDVRFLLEQSTVDFLGILELTHADGIVTLDVALGVQWVEDLVLLLLFFARDLIKI